MGEKLRSLRRKMHMTLKEVSSELGVSLNSVYRWEHDLAIPRKEALRQMAEMYEVPMKWLLYGVSAEENIPVSRNDEKFEQYLISICRKLSENNKYKVLGYAERIWIETINDENAEVERNIGT
jgi:transcriptional regulator with XRE-family HTH domain